jgi:tRNA A22 N-methylase
LPLTKQAALVPQANTRGINSMTLNVEVLKETIDNAITEANNSSDIEQIQILADNLNTLQQEQQDEVVSEN